MSQKKNLLAETVDALARKICHENFPKGDLAELRRLRLECPPPAFWRLLAVVVLPKLDCETDLKERAWGVIMQGMAIMAPKAHSLNRPVGRVLASLGNAGNSNHSDEAIERRFWTLLRSRDEQLEDQVRILSRFLSAKEEAVDWCGLARLLLAPDEVRRDEVCRNLARTFYFGAARTETTTL